MGIRGRRFKTRRVDGVVLERNGRWATVLGRPGMFVRLRAQASWQVGDRVEWRQPVLPRWLSAAAGGAVAAAMLLGLLSLSAPPVPAAYVSLEMTPDVQLSVTAQGVVAGVTALDSSGRQVVAGLSLRGDSLATAIAVVTRAEIRSVGPGVRQRTAVLAAYPASNRARVPASVVRRLPAVQTDAELAARSQGVKLSVAPMVVNHGMEAAARQARLPVGTYALYLAVRQSGATVDARALREEGLDAPSLSSSSVERVVAGLAVPIGQPERLGAAPSTPAPGGFARRRWVPHMVIRSR